MVVKKCQKRKSTSLASESVSEPRLDVATPIQHRTSSEPTKSWPHDEVQNGKSNTERKNVVIKKWPIKNEIFVEMAPLKITSYTLWSLLEGKKTYESGHQVWEASYYDDVTTRVFRQTYATSLRCPPSRSTSLNDADSQPLIKPLGQHSPEDPLFLFQLQLALV